MRAKVDPEVCVGCELCTQTSPQVFVMESDKAVARSNPVPQEAEESCRRAKEDCPVGAISITD